ncbi:hypothetical protein AMTR_s00065p00192950 [Amborella trichopoda]|uniref:Uncharacterized protein n=1 Tax=Amborella trichopoda TaxID=13333 RepID=U5D869_AMBTC|nr:hypothetical protein AMTR_s00065p00192950 [Amborella trichopoda]
MDTGVTFMEYKGLVLEFLAKSPKGKSELLDACVISRVWRVNLKWNSQPTRKYLSSTDLCYLAARYHS